ncbi:MAG: hypothetical protein ACM3P1_12510 [Candidatus Saccharibacteria bacterium]
MKDKYIKPFRSFPLQKLPFRPILTIVIIAVVCELLIMALLESLHIHNVYLSGYLDTILLLILLSNFLYFLVMLKVNK